MLTFPPCFRYMLLLEQFEAVSFGDSLFACYLLLPLQQKHDLLLRKAVWGEHVGVLRALFVPIKQVSYFLVLSIVETELTIAQRMYSIIMGDVITEIVI